MTDTLSRTRRPLAEWRRRAADGAQAGLEHWDGRRCNCTVHECAGRQRYTCDHLGEFDVTAADTAADMADALAEGRADLAAQCRDILRELRGRVTFDLWQCRLFSCYLAALLLAVLLRPRTLTTADCAAPPGPPPDLSPALLIVAPGAPQLRACAPCL